MNSKRPGITSQPISQSVLTNSNLQAALELLPWPRDSWNDRWCATVFHRHIYSSAYMKIVLNTAGAHGNAYQTLHHWTLHHITLHFRLPDAQPDGAKCAFKMFNMQLSLGTVHEVYNLMKFTTKQFDMRMDALTELKLHYVFLSWFRVPNFCLII